MNNLAPDTSMQASLQESSYESATHRPKQDDSTTEFVAQVSSTTLFALGLSAAMMEMMTCDLVQRLEKLNAALTCSFERRAGLFSEGRMAEALHGLVEEGRDMNSITSYPCILRSTVQDFETKAVMPEWVTNGIQDIFTGEILNEISVEDPHRKSSSASTDFAVFQYGSEKILAECSNGFSSPLYQLAQKLPELISMGSQIKCSSKPNGTIQFEESGFSISRESLKSPCSDSSSRRGDAYSRRATDEESYNNMIRSLSSRCSGPRHSESAVPNLKLSSTTDKIFSVLVSPGFARRAKIFRSEMARESTSSQYFPAEKARNILDTPSLCASHDRVGLEECNFGDTATRSDEALLMMRCSSEKANDEDASSASGKSDMGDDEDDEERSSLRDPHNENVVESNIIHHHDDDVEMASDNDSGGGGSEGDDDDDELSDEMKGCCCRSSIGSERTDSSVVVDIYTKNEPSIIKMRGSLETSDAPHQMMSEADNNPSAPFACFGPDTAGSPSMVSAEQGPPTQSDREDSSLDEHNDEDEDYYYEEDDNIHGMEDDEPEVQIPLPAVTDSQHTPLATNTVPVFKNAPADYGPASEPPRTTSAFRAFLGRLAGLSAIPPAPASQPTFKGHSPVSPDLQMTVRSSIGGNHNGYGPTPVRRVHRTLRAVPKKDPRDSAKLSDDEQEYDENIKFLPGDVARWCRRTSEWHGLVREQLDIDPLTIFGCGTKPVTYKDIFTTPDFRRAFLERSVKSVSRDKFLTTEARGGREKRWEDDRVISGFTDGVPAAFVEQYRNNLSKNRDLSHLVYEPTWTHCDESCIHDSVSRQPWYAKVKADKPPLSNSNTELLP